MRVRRGSVQQITLCFDGRTYLKSVRNNKRIVSESSEFLRSARPSCDLTAIRRNVIGI